MKKPNTIFTPETMKDEYHEAFNKQLPRLCLRPELEEMIKATRQNDPEIYKSLAALAKEFGDHALQLGVRIYLDTKGIE